MSETRFHGARVTENTDLVTAINDVDSSVIGIVATADDADAKLFPLNKPTLLTRVNDVLGKCGTTGTLYRALKAIADQVSTKVIVVRVAEHKEEDGKTQDQLVIGGSEDDGSYTGMYALLVAEQDESIGYRPRILARPELDTEAVTKSLCVIAGKLRAFVYASCHGCNTMAEAITYRQKFNEREGDALMAGLHRLQTRKVAKTKNVPRACLCVRPFVRTLTMSRAGTNRCPTFRLKMCWGCRGMCSGRCRPKTAMPTASTTKKSRPLFVATGSASGATAHRKRTPTFLRCIPEPHRCWLINCGSAV
ncbi:Major tail sheath protein FI [Escherichia coli]|uniref:Major tail sheath protein FI n=1 Tax=Escherichia coli TaxID=562 RepID=A0A2X1L312_ECOLX|nr:Major tail sheath protein FI [Escherichia coli]